MCCVVFIITSRVFQRLESVVRSGTQQHRGAACKFMGSNIHIFFFFIIVCCWICFVLFLLLFWLLNSCMHAAGATSNCAIFYVITPLCLSESRLCVLIMYLFMLRFTFLFVTQSKHTYGHLRAFVCQDWLHFDSLHTYIMIHLSMM